MNIVLNEREFAESALETCSIGQKPLETIGRIARYYAANGYKRNEICSLLEEFLLKCDPGINIVKWQTTIEKQAKMACKASLIEIDSIPITQRELDVCDGLNRKQIQRLMFTLICLAKFSNAVNEKNGDWVNRPDREIFKMANVVTPVKRQSLLLHDLRELGLVRFSRKVDNVNINVLCVDNGGDTALHISDFRNLGYQYMRHCGKPYFECEACGLVIKRTNNSQRYCLDCGTEINRQKSRENWKLNMAG